MFQRLKDWLFGRKPAPEAAPPSPTTTVSAHGPYRTAAVVEGEIAPPMAVRAQKPVEPAWWWPGKVVSAAPVRTPRRIVAARTRLADSMDTERDPRRHMKCFRRSVGR